MSARQWGFVDKTELARAVARTIADRPYRQAATRKRLADMAEDRRAWVPAFDACPDCWAPPHELCYDNCPRFTEDPE